MKIQARHGFAAGVAVLLAIVLSTSSVIVTNQPTASAATWRYESDRMVLSGGFFIPSWRVVVETEYRVNGTKVEVTNVNCYGGGVGVDLSITWCGAYRKWVSGRPWMEFGATFKVTIKLAIVDVATKTGWVRRAVGPGGDTCCSRRG